MGCHAFWPLHRTIDVRMCCQRWSWRSLGNFVCLHIDNILIFSINAEEHQ